MAMKVVKPVYGEGCTLLNDEEVIAAIVSNKGFHNVNIKNPVTIQDKINWLKVYDISKLKALCADKIAVHDYCVDKLGIDICVPILKIYESPDNIKLEELPNRFVLKCNHGAAMNVICKDKRKFDLADAKKKICKWLTVDLGTVGMEYHYSFIKPKCFAEKYIADDSSSSGLTDYKVWCFGGEPGFVQVMANRYTENKYTNMYDLNWNKLDTGYNMWPFNPDVIDQKPKHFDQMIEYATKLCKDFKFVRVDFYDTTDKLYLGEMTFTPSNGRCIFSDSFGNPWAAKIK